MRKPTRRVKTTTRRKPTAKTSAAATRRKPSRRQKSEQSETGFDRGATGFKKAKQKRERQEAEYQRRKNMPFDFRLKPGDEAEVVILDNEPPFFINLHKVKDSRGRWIDEVCIADTGVACSLCSSLGKEGSYTMLLTVLDRRPYTIKNGPNAGKTIKASRKLFMVKGRNLPKFERQYQRHKGNWRGLRILCRRDGDKEAAIGEDLEFLGKVKETALAKYRENAQPVDYAEVFPIPSAKELAARYSLDNSVAGSEEFQDDDDADLENVGW
jgi:hypothetical protein